MRYSMDVFDFILDVASNIDVLFTAMAILLGFAAFIANSVNNILKKDPNCLHI